MMLSPAVQTSATPCASPVALACGRGEKPTRRAQLGAHDLDRVGAKLGGLAAKAVSRQAEARRQAAFANGASTATPAEARCHDYMFTEHLAQPDPGSACEGTISTMRPRAEAVS